MSRTAARTPRATPVVPATKSARTDRASVSAKAARGVAVAEPPARAAKAVKPAAKPAQPAPKPTAKAARPAKAPPKPVPLSERPIEQVWREYRTTPSELVRNFLMERYLELVRYTAERMHMKLPAEVEVDDLMSAGLFGLMDAINAFDPDRGVKFETYCTQRIRGAIFDELRSMDWVPRLVRSRTAKVEKVRKSLEMESGRRPTDVEVAERMKVDAGEFEKLQKDSRPVGLVSLNRKWFETDSSKDVREIDVIKDTRQENPIQLVQRQDLQTLITKGLSRAERLIVVLYYYEEMTMKEIGLTLDLSESRVSQMHSSILARLKAQMQHRTKDI